MFYGAMVWDTWLIVAQIVCFQCLFYLTLGVFLSFLVATHISRMSLVYFFDFATNTSSTVFGWCVIASFLLSSLQGWPSSITWWVVNGNGVGVMALLGEYSCIKRELREIPT